MKNHFSVKLNLSRSFKRELKIAAVRAGIWIAPFAIILFVSSVYDIRMSSEGSLFIVPVMFGAVLSEVSQMVAVAVTERLFRRREEEV
jgi:hypothetical protein